MQNSPFSNKIITSHSTVSLVRGLGLVVVVVVAVVVVAMVVVVVAVVVAVVVGVGVGSPCASTPGFCFFRHRPRLG